MILHIVVPQFGVFPETFLFPISSKVMHKWDVWSSVQITETEPIKLLLLHNSDPQFSITQK